jgi:hypothetical protein
MLTTPGQAPAHRWTIIRSGHFSGASSECVTPAQRIALTIALINWGFDLLDGVARTSLARCTPGVIRSRHRPQATRAALHQR